MMPPKEYAKARASAEGHIQIRIIRVAPPTCSPGETVVTGDVTTIFHGSEIISYGDRISLRVSTRHSDERVPPSGVLWVNYERLVAAPCLEAYINRGAGGYEIALWQVCLLSNPTEQPMIPLEDSA